MAESTPSSASRFFEYSHPAYSLFDINTEFIKRLLDGRCAGKRALDYGCGSGVWACYLARAGAEAYGIDESSGAIERAKEVARNEGLAAQFEVMDAHATSFPNDFFDLVLISGVLQYLDLDRAYRELARILKPGGQIIAEEGLRHNLAIQFYRRSTPVARSTWGRQRILGKPEIKQALAYFDDVRPLKFFHLLDIAALPLRNSRLFVPLRKMLHVIDSALLSLPLIRWQAWMVVLALSLPRKT